MIKPNYFYIIRKYQNISDSFIAISTDEFTPRFNVGGEVRKLARPEKKKKTSQGAVKVIQSVNHFSQLVFDSSKTLQVH